MRIKKIISGILAVTMVMSMMTGCGTGSSDSEENTGITKAENAAESTANSDNADSTAAAPAGGNGKTLVVYYSATGSTKAVAETIADSTGGGLFEIQPKDPYTDADLDWTDDNSRVSKEHEDESLRDVALTTTKVENWDSYDTVFIGYPIWWAIAAWPVDNFVKNNDFSGKTVIPFCTSSSSGIGESGQLLAKMAGTGNWQAGERFTSGVSQTDVEAWVKDLGYAKSDAQK